MLIIPELRRLRQEDRKFEASLGQHRKFKATLGYILKLSSQD
jgi:hypothetical protein